MGLWRREREVHSLLQVIAGRVVLLQGSSSFLMGLSVLPSLALGVDPGVVTSAVPAAGTVLIPYGFSIL